MYSFNDLTLYLGKGRSPADILRACFLTAGTLLYILLAGRALHTHIFYLKNRVTYDTHFDEIISSDSATIIVIIIMVTISLWVVLTSRNIRVIAVLLACLILLTIESLLAYESARNLTTLVSVPFLLTVTLFYKSDFQSKFKELALGFPASLFSRYLAAVVLGLSVCSMVLSVTRLYSIPYDEGKIWDYAYGIFVLLSSLSPLFITIILFTVPIKLVLITVPFARLNLRSNKLLLSDVINKYRTAILIFSIALAVAIAGLPHLGRQEITPQLIGVDTHYYKSWVDNLAKAHNLTEFVRMAFFVEATGDRPLVLILIHSLWSVTHLDLVTVIEYLPVVLAPSLSIVIYFLTKELTSDERASLLASIISGVAFQTLVGIYAGFYANWFALVFAYSSIMFLVRYLKNKGKMNLIFSFILYVALSMTHIYTWVVITIVLVIFLALNIRFDAKHSNSVMLSFFLIFMMVLAGIIIVKIVLTSSHTLLLGSQMTGAENFSNRVDILYDAVQTYYGGLLSNAIILLPGIAWIFLFRINTLDTKLICIFLSLAAPSLFFGDVALQTRLIYEIPFPVMAGLTLAYLSRQPKLMSWTIAILVFVISMGIRSVVNFYFISPGSPSL